MTAANVDQVLALVSGARSRVPEGSLQSCLREFAADCLDAIDTGGRHRDSSALARRVARGEVGREALLEGRLAASPGAPTALGAMSSYHIAGAAVKFAALGALADTAEDAARNVARHVALYRGYTLLHSLPDNPIAGQRGWSGETMWQPWCAFAERHYEAEQAEIKRAEAELAAALVARLRAVLPLAIRNVEASPATPRQVLRPIDPTNVVPFPTGDIALDSMYRWYLEQGKWPSLTTDE